jgi:acetylornithine deacetylase/succinyl-diaminopimelate desuccinylase-like protein
VQPVDPLELWESPPFEATCATARSTRAARPTTRGRSSCTSRRSRRTEAERRLPVNIKIILEGEEEVGSANLDNFIKAQRDELAADVVVISDSPMFDRGIPSICYGLRGLVYFQIDLRGTKSDLHSGSFGGAVANPAWCSRRSWRR